MKNGPVRLEIPEATHLDVGKLFGSLFQCQHQLIGVVTHSITTQSMGVSSLQLFKSLLEFGGLERRNAINLCTSHKLNL